MTDPFSHVKIFCRAIRAIAVVILAMSIAGGVSRPAEAIASLQITPLKYQAQLHAGAPQQGIITVYNPTDSSVTVQSQVQAVRQTGTGGELQYYDDKTISAGIKISSDKVVIPPHRNVSFIFQINPDVLPQRGIYAVIFFRTLPSTSANGTRILQSVRLGTLLLLQNGTDIKTTGKVTGIKFPPISYGSALSGMVTYKNTGNAAFNPKLSITPANSSESLLLNGPYIMPGSQRAFSFHLSGSHIGRLRITVRDIKTGTVTEASVWTVSGIWTWLLPLLIGLFLTTVLFFVDRRNKTTALSDALL